MSQHDVSIVHISTVHPADDARILYREAQALAADGWQVHVYGVRNGDTEIGNVQVHGLPARRGRLRRIMTSWWRALRIVRRHRATIYQFHDFELLPAALLARMLLRKRVVFDAHEDVSLITMKDWLPRVLRRPLAWVVHRIVAGSARRMNGIVVPTRLLNDQYRLWARRVVTFVNYPASHFIVHRDEQWLPWEDRKNEVVHLGTLSNRRINFILQVAASFLRRHEDWEWTILGLHPEMVELGASHIPEDLRGRLKVTGKIPHSEVAGRICQARLAINYHPLDSRQIEVALPVKVFEYLACGVPVVTTRNPLLVEMVHDCPAVKLTDEGRESYLAALEEAVTTGDMGLLSRQARQFSDERFSCAAEARNLAEFYKKIIAENGQKTDK